MSIDSVANFPANAPPPVPIYPTPEQIPRVLSRKRRMNFFDLANLLDSDGNLQNEMMVFAFAATMLSTIPILLGNEFDVNVGLRRKRRMAGPYRDPDQAESTYYAAYSEQYPYSGYGYKELMTSLPSSYIHVHNRTRIPEEATANHNTGEATVDHTTGEPIVTHKPEENNNNPFVDASLTQSLEDLLQWSQSKTKNKSLLPLLINLVLDKYSGNINPADKLVRNAYKKWIKYWY